jgi:hypothetical protein
MTMMFICMEIQRSVRSCPITIGYWRLFLYGGILNSSKWNFHGFLMRTLGNAWQKFGINRSTDKTLYRDGTGKWGLSVNT